MARNEPTQMYILMFLTCSSLVLDALCVLTTQVNHYTDLKF